MLRRCYSEKHQIKNPSYKQCSVCEEWLCYANFEKWYDDNYYEVPNQIMNLDKDILSKGNKIYCPDKCIFVPKEINSTFVNSRSVRGEYPVGVNYNIKNKKFISRCCIGKRHRIHLGSFNTPEEAFYAYKEFKEKYIKQIADEYKQYIPQKLYDAMYRYEVEITD